MLRYSLVVGTMVSLVAADDTCLPTWANGVKYEWDPSTLFNRLQQTCKPKTLNRPRAATLVYPRNREYYEEIMRKLVDTLVRDFHFSGYEMLTDFGAFNVIKEIHHRGSIIVSSKIICYIYVRVQGRSKKKYSLGVVHGVEAGKYLLATSEDEDGAWFSPLTTIAEAITSGNTFVFNS